MNGLILISLVASSRFRVPIRSCGGQLMTSTGGEATVFVVLNGSMERRGTRVLPCGTLLRIAFYSLTSHHLNTLPDHTKWKVAKYSLLHGMFCTQSFSMLVINPQMCPMTGVNAHTYIVVLWESIPQDEHQCDVWNFQYKRLAPLCASFFIFFLHSIICNKLSFHPFLVSVFKNNLEGQLISQFPAYQPISSSVSNRSQVPSARIIQ